METVGFIGLGNMGGGMAGNIQKADYPMVVLDLRQDIMQPFVDNGAKMALISPMEGLARGLQESCGHVWPLQRRLSSHPVDGDLLFSPKLPIPPKVRPII